MSIEGETGFIVVNFNNNNISYYYNVKYSQIYNKINVTIPGFSMELNRSDRFIPEEYIDILKEEYNWNDEMIESFRQMIFSDKWKIGSTLNNDGIFID